MAAKKESVAKCAGTLQYGVGRPDGANTMIKTIQYLAEADSSRVLVALDLKAAFQNVSRRAMPHSIEHSDPDLADVFSRWCIGTSEERLHNAVPALTRVVNGQVEHARMDLVVLITMAPPRTSMLLLGPTSPAARHSLQQPAPSRSHRQES